jgi:hypothetical protein
MFVRKFVCKTLMKLTPTCCYYIRFKKMIKGNRYRPKNSSFFWSLKQESQTGLLFWSVSERENVCEWKRECVCLCVCLFSQTENGNASVSKVISTLKFLKLKKWGRYKYLDLTHSSNHLNVSKNNSLLRLHCDTRFQRAFIACSWVFEVITLVWANQGN